MATANKVDAYAKFRYSAYSGLVFLLIASPYAYQLTQTIFGGIYRVASASGHPTTAGLLLHTVVYTLILFGLMHVKYL